MAMANDDRRALAAESALTVALDVWANAAEGGAIERGDGWTLALAGAPLRSFNNLLIGDAAAPVARLVDRARARAAHGRFRVRLREDVAIDDAVFERAGLARQGGIPCLVIEPAGALPVAQKVAPVLDTASLADHVAVVADGFRWAAEDVARACTPALLADARWRGFVSYADGRPAAAAQLVLAGDAGAGIYFVATREEARGRGLGTAVTAAAVNAALAAGARAVALQASPMGLPVYERMGFVRVSYYRTFVPLS